MTRILFLLFFFSMKVIAVEYKPLVVGMELTYPPFEMVNTDGAPTGISVDIAQALGKYLNRPVIIKNIAFVGLIPALNSDKIDLAISSMTITAERQRAIDFSNPYLATGLSLLVSAKSPLKGIEEANNSAVTMAVKSGTSGEVYAREHLQNANVLVLDKEVACVLEVVQGKADGFIYDQLSVYNNWLRHQDTTRAVLTPFQKEYWGVGLRKGNAVLLKQVNDFLEEFKKQGGFDKLADKYLVEQKAAFKKLNIPFVF